MPKRSLTENKTVIRIVLVSLIIYMFLYLWDHIWRNIFRNSPNFLTYILLDSTVIFFAIGICWFCLKRGKNVYSELSEYTRGLNTVFVFMCGCLVGLIFLVLSIKDLQFYMSFSALCFTITGFSFTAGSFFNKKRTFATRFFRVSILFAITGFLSLIFFMFFGIIANIEPENIVIFHYYFDTVELNKADVAGVVLAFFVLTLGFLFWLSFMQLIRLLIAIPKIREDKIKTRKNVKVRSRIRRA